MIKKLFVFLAFVLLSQSFASNHGIYLLTVSNLKGDIQKVGEEIKSKLENAGFNVQYYDDLATPDIVRKDKKDQCGLKAKLIVATSSSYSQMITSYGNKYLVAAFLRVGIYETEDGIQVQIADPETINRIIFNDLYEEGKEKEYFQVVNKTKEFKSQLIKAIHAINGGNKVEKPMPPIRSDEDLQESARDMFMMVGKMTFFNDEDQFPQIYARKNSEGKAGIEKLLSEIKNNLKNFKPTKEDVEYRWTSSPEILKWKIISMEYSPDSTAVVLGITRTRTEGLSFHIAGSSRESSANKCPGIDHAAAYPIEVLVMQKGNQVVVHTARQMFRMDMYFWDAGMAAFMNHMSMPGILDESIRKAVLGNSYEMD
jgi:uncharacterized protein (DUF302 family)